MRRALSAPATSLGFAVLPGKVKGVPAIGEVPGGGVMQNPPRRLVRGWCPHLRGDAAALSEMDATIIRTVVYISVEPGDWVRPRRTSSGYWSIL